MYSRADQGATCVVQPNLIHLPVHKLVVEGPIPREISLKTEESATAWGPLCFLTGVVGAIADFTLCTVVDQVSLRSFRSLWHLTLRATFFLHQVYLYNPHKANLALYQFPESKGGKGNFLRNFVLYFYLFKSNNQIKFFIRNMS